LEDTVYKPRKVGEEVVKCPVCGADARLELYIHNAPIPGPVLIMTMRCPRCGYRFRDVSFIEEGGRPLRIRIRVEEPDDLNTIVFRGPRASIRVPELGIEITPGPAHQGDITTVDGILALVHDHVEPLCSNLEDPEGCRGFLRRVESFLKGVVAEPITVEIVDPEGISTVYRSKKRNYVVEPLEEPPTQPR